MSTKAKSERLHDLLRTGRRYSLVKKQIIQSTEDRQVVNLITKGYVKRYQIANDGALGIQVVYGPGDIFPLTLVFKGLFNQNIYDGPEVYYYEAMCDAETYTIDLDALLKEVENDPTLYRDLLSESGKRLLSTLNGLENLTLRSSYKRVAHQLAYFARQFGEKTPAGIVLPIPLTHEDIANVLSTTRETISTCMIKLRKKGLIEAGKNIVIPDLEKLEKEGYS